MGWASLLAGSAKNPFTSFLADNSNAIRGFGAGLGSGADLNTGLAYGASGAAQGAQQDDAFAVTRKAEADRQAELNKTVAWARSQYPDLASAPDEIVAEMAPKLFYESMKPKTGPAPTADMQNFEYAQAHPEFADYQTQKGGAAETSLQPTWGTDTDPQSPTYNQPVLGQLNKAGVFVKTQLPPGVQAMDPATLAGGKAGATVDAKTAGAARAALRGAEVSNQNTAKAVAELRNNAAGMKEWFGQIGPRGMYINPGSEMGKFYAAAEPTNNQGFMQAREMLKGGGQITDYEGRKAEDAFSRMRASLETGDQEQYLRAVSDFEEAVATGYQKLVETAQGGYSAGAPGAAGGGNKTTSGVSWSVEP